MEEKEFIAKMSMAVGHMELASGSLWALHAEADKRGWCAVSEAIEVARRNLQKAINRINTEREESFGPDHDDIEEGA